jgi:hypothetical protein
MSGGWGCPYHLTGKCRKLKMRECDPGIKGCVLHGKYNFPLNEKKNKKKKEPAH